MDSLVIIDPEDTTPPFEQVRRQLTLLIETGELVTDERLPPVRRMAEDLDLAVNTVARAYKELEAAGLITTRRGAGTRVAPRAATAGPAELEAAAQDYLSRAAELGAGPDRAVQILEIVARRTQR